MQENGVPRIATPRSRALVQAASGKARASSREANRWMLEMEPLRSPNAEYTVTGVFEVSLFQVASCATTMPPGTS